MIRNVYIGSHSLSDYSESTANDVHILDSYNLIIESIRSAVGEDAADFFALPQVVRGNGASATSVAWYASSSGAIQQWRELDFHTQIRVAGEVGAILERLRPLLSDPGIGPLLQRWLNVTDIGNNLHLVGGRPVLVNWGLLPSATAASMDARDRTFASNLGRFAPWLTTPPFHSLESVEPTPPSPTPTAAPASPVEPSRSHNEAAALVPPEMGASLAPEGQVAAMTAAQAAPAGSTPSRAWLPVAIACAVAAMMLILLLIPGVLLYPNTELGQGSAAGTEAVLRQRIEDLQQKLQARTCQGSAVPGSPRNLLSPRSGALDRALFPAGVAPIVPSSPAGGRLAMFASAALTTRSLTW
ncbi:hypothetical protein FHS55_003558 [Angulomicrobium tetraedrale]|uniref:Uncharacterized protein n=1 Tax=Ancylobacter tetraedralis TaxID=217068 RepID=A0A839ZDQ8_9HYPH|nr:hypothetical protein [Ancylobacter tetraedralis]MBB3772933.1 hypothetical protein [Ancylobacter tetraedralis]